MKKLLLLLGIYLFVGIVMIGVVSAIPTYPQGKTIQIQSTCDNCTGVNLTKVTFPNGTFALLGQYPMTKNGTNYNYSFSNSATSGIYDYATCGDLNGILTCEDTTERSFEVTYSGLILKEGQGIFYMILFTILIFFFIMVLFGINQLPASNTQDEEGKILSISYLKYFRPVGWMFEYILVVAILYLSSNLAFAYLNEALFAQILFVLFRITFMAAPIVVIVWIIWIFVQMFHDKQMQNLLNRGFFPQGKL